jgi:hypothetical protein
MKAKVILPALAILVLGGAGFYLIWSHTLYLSHEAVVNETIADVINTYDGQLPQQEADLAIISGDPSMAGNRVTEWRAEAVELENAAGINQSLMDDDPVYGLKADLHVSYEDGREAVMRWESWRYGFVVGPVVLSTGDGPPGRIVAVSFHE